MVGKEWGGVTECGLALENFIVASAMLLSTILSSSKSIRSTAAVERFFNALLGLTIIGVVYRYCWTGMYLKAHALWFPRLISVA
jgi:chromate transport protein ChrA